MSQLLGNDATPPIETKADLIAPLEAGCKPADQWRIGTEHEKFGYRLSDLTPLPYDGDNGIAAMLTGLLRYGWEPVHEDRNIIALKQGGASVSLEPGGQFELSGDTLTTLHETCN